MHVLEHNTAKLKVFNKCNSKVTFVTREQFFFGDEEGIGKAFVFQT